MMLLSMRILILLVAEMMNYSQSFSYQKVRSFSVNKRDNVICKIVKIQSQQKPEDNEQKKYLKNTVTSIWNFIYPWQGLSDKIDNLASLITNSSNGVDGKFDRIDGKFDRIDGRFDRIDSKFDRIEDSLEELMADYDFARKLTMRNQLTTTYSSRYARRTNVANLNSLVDLFGTKPFQMFEGDSTDPLEVVSKRRHRVASNFLSYTKTIRDKLDSIIDARKSPETFSDWVQSWLNLHSVESDCPVQSQVEKLLVSPPDSPFTKYKSSIRKAQIFLDTLDNVTNIFERVNIVSTHEEEFMLCLSLLFLDPIVELAFDRTIFYRNVEFDVTGDCNVEFTTDPPSTIVRIVIGEIKTNISKKSIASIINQLSIRASMFSWAARFMSPNCTGAVTAKGFLQKNSKDAGRVDSLIMENGLTKRKLAPGFQVTFTEEVV